MTTTQSARQHGQQRERRTKDDNVLEIQSLKPQDISCGMVKILVQQQQQQL